MALSNGHGMNEKLAGNNLPDADISVVDVYDLASDIGKECEKIIDLYGAEALTALMPKVVHTLEQLEAMASRNENENTTIQTLTDRVAYLESEKIEKAVFRERLQRVRNLLFSLCGLLIRRKLNYAWNAGGQTV